MVQLQLLFATVLATLASTSAFTRPHAGLTRPAFAKGPRSAVAGGRRASTGAVTMMAEGDADPKEKKGATVNIVGEGARGGYFRTTLKNEALFRAINTEYARSADGCVLRAQGRRSSIEGLKRWCLSKKPGQGPGLSTIIDSVDIDWMDELPNIDTKWADITPAEFAFEEMSADEVIEAAKM
mmetsp:Transcript_3418/g.7115  ORF Transcript_3418/g.7115 Transcript_3418/m.7115 type:complete len:182 (-) Transcript_3418:216-761(-)